MVTCGLAKKKKKRYRVWQIFHSSVVEFNTDKHISSLQFLLLVDYLDLNLLSLCTYLRFLTIWYTVQIKLD